jgi:hypothetical protein
LSESPSPPPFCGIPDAAGAELDSGAAVVVGAAGADWLELVVGAAGADLVELVAGAAGADLVELVVGATGADLVELAAGAAAVELDEFEEPAELDLLELPHPAAARATSTTGTAAAKRGLSQRAWRPRVRIVIAVSPRVAIGSPSALIRGLVAHAS